MKIIITLLFLIPSIVTAKIQLDKIKLPSGFKISLFAKDIEGARSMTWGKSGILFVGSRSAGKVYAIDKSGKVFTLAKNLNMPNGVAFRNGALYVAEIQRIIKFENIEQNLNSPPKAKVIATYPDDSHHGWKFIAFGPDGKLYVPQGAPCNICEVKDPYGTITSINEDGTNKTVYARGVRNSVGFDWHPVTKELWFTDNGRDQMGDNIPPDELNKASKSGMHFGYPYCHAGELLDPKYGKGKSCKDYVAPMQKLGPHVAALGMRFYKGKSFPKKYLHNIFIAEHGSWNRSEPLGYRITIVDPSKTKEKENYEIFAQGWRSDGETWGRPVDIIETPDGSILISDDYADAIYKISYSEK